MLSKHDGRGDTQSPQPTTIQPKVESAISIELPKKQLEFPGIDTDRHAVETRLAAMTRERSPKLLTIVELVRQRRQLGMTRDEISLELKVAPTTPCSPVLALIRDGELIETAHRRPTRFGSSAVVLVHRDFRPQEIST